MLGIFRILIGAVTFLALSHPGFAQSGAQVPTPGSPLGLSESLTVPGGIQALARVIGLDGITPRGLALLEIIRVVYEVEEGIDKRLDARRARMLGYLAAVSRFERARTQLPAGPLSLKLVEQKSVRPLVDQFARSVGSRLEGEDQAPRLLASDTDEDVARRQWLKEAGLDIPGLIRDFNGGASITPSLPAEDVPLPIPAAAWNAVATPSEEMSGCLFTVLLSDRRLALSYYGLSGMDRQTRAWLASSPYRLKRLLVGPRTGALATRGRSLRVRDERIDVPGGPAAVSLWEALVGVRTSDPTSFIWMVLGRDQGRLALFYDALDHLDPPSQRFALGLSLPDLSDRVRQLAALYRAFERALAGWDAGARPFLRAVDDGAHLLMVTRTTPNGQPAPPAGRRLWQLVFDNAELSSDHPSERAGLKRDVPLDAASLVEAVCTLNTTIRLQRLETWQFAQRVFPDAPPDALPDVVVALRGLARFRLLLLTLERMGIRDPSVYAAAIRHAQRLARIVDRERLAVGLGQFQGALAMLERVRFSRAISAGTAARLVRTLSALSLSSGDEYQGGVAAWLESQLLPALESSSQVALKTRDGPGPIESRVLAAIAGLRPDGDPLPTVEWEGLRYRVDLGAAEFDRLSRTRRKQGGVSLDGVLAFCRETNAVSAGVTSLAAMPARVGAIKSAFASVTREFASGAVQHPAMAGRERLVKDALDGLQTLGARDFAKLDRAAMPLRRVGDWLTASVLTSLAYAPSLGDPDGPSLLAGDPASRHDLGVDERTPELQLAAAWRLPEERTGGAGGWRSFGSLLGLDVGLARLALRRVANDSLAVAPTESDSDRAAITQTMVLLNPFDMIDSEKTAVADAIRRGRARFGLLRSNTAGLEQILRVVRMGEWRREALSWALDHEPDRVLEYFSVVDLLRVGESESSALPPLDAWGAARYSVDGCLCVRFPASEPWENYTGMKGKVLVVSQVADLALRIADVLAELGLPARLTRSMMAYATQDLLDGMRPPFGDDWATVVAGIRRIPRARMEDYIAALTTGGPLVPADRDDRE